MWKVLLVGGSSGTGKTLLAQQIARYYAADRNQVDDYRLVLERTTKPQQHPALHYFSNPTNLPDFWLIPAAALAERYKKVARVMSGALEIVVANHCADASPLVLEGDTITRAFAALPVYAGRRAETGEVQAIFLHEPDEAQILANMRQRGRGVTDTETLCNIARMSWLYGQWLRDEATRYSIPIIASRPFDTLFGRVVAALGQPTV